MAKLANFELLAKVETACRERARKLDVAARKRWRDRLDDRAGALEQALRSGSGDSASRRRLFRVWSILDVAWSAT
jgi:hypothetical protein